MFSVVVLIIEKDFEQILRSMETLYIIDASGYLYRSYHAIQNLTNHKGESTNALYGFVRSLLKLFKDFHPQHIIAVFDGPNGIEKRKKLFANYKAQRAKMPEDLRYQIGWAQEFCDLAGIASLSIPEVEADDTMGSIAKWAASQGVKVFLCTSDKDLCQLVDKQVSILNTHKDNLILGPEEIKSNFGIHPHQMIDYLAIVGDSSDNVPGIPGFGPKTAAKLLEEMGSLENILNHPENIQGQKKQEIIKASKESALLSQQLVTIDTQVPFPKDFYFFSLKPPQEDLLKAFYHEKKFLSLLKELEQSFPKKKKEEISHYHLVDDEEALEKLLEALFMQKEVCFDIEATHWHPLKAKIVGVGFGFQKGEAWYIPLNGNLKKEVVIERLKKIFNHPGIAFFAHNGKYDLHVLLNHGITVKTLSFDTILASYLLAPENRQHGLDSLSLQFLGIHKIPITDLIGKGKQEISIDHVPIKKMAEYCGEDVDCSFQLKERFEKDLEERKLSPLLYNLELPLLHVLLKMERKGLYLDKECLNKVAQEISKTLIQLEKEIFELAGESFNLKSPQQLSRILFEKMKITPPKKTATGHSTSADVLESLEETHLIAAKMLTFRSLEKLRSSYIETLPLEILPETGRIHPNFNQFVAATGRLSCQDPNLQQIPIRTEMGKKIREAFRPEKNDWSYLGSDYSQIELRLLAHFSEDPALLSAFHSEEDIHAHTASLVFSIPLSAVTEEKRRQAKAVNFGILYGQQAFGLARELKISFTEASQFITTYFDRFKKVKEFIESCKETARKSGKTLTLLGRERALPEIHSKNPQIRAAAERLAINTPLQGTAADLIKKSMIAIDKKLEKEKLKGYLVLQIHDELIFEVPDVEIHQIKSLVKLEMEEVFPLKVPLLVNLSVGKNWKEC